MELMHVRWRDIDNDVTLRVTKGGKKRRPRRVTLNADTLAVLHRRKVTRGALNLALVRPGAYVFGDAEGKLVGRRRRPCTSGAPCAAPATRSVRTRCRRSGCTGSGTGTRRSTSWLVSFQNGMPIHVLSARLGHANPAITLGVYSHVLPGAGDRYAQEVANRLKSKISGTSITEPGSEAADGV